MTSSFTTLSRQGLKAEARIWRAQQEARGTSVTHGAALEAVARHHGFRDWNAAAALLPESAPVPLMAGDRVTGRYLGHAFEGTLLAAGSEGAGLTRVTVQFDRPINVTAGSPYAHIRRRVSAVLDEAGDSPARTGDGAPQMHLRRA